MMITETVLLKTGKMPVLRKMGKVPVLLRRARCPYSGRRARCPCATRVVQSCILIVSLSVRFCIRYNITFLQDFYIDAVLNELTTLKFFI